MPLKYCSQIREFQYIIIVNNNFTKQHRMNIPKNRYFISAIIATAFFISLTLSSCNTASTVVPPTSAATPLDPPAAGTGFQVSSGKFDVAPNFEREIFIYRDLGNAAPIYINRIHSKLLPNSHHMVMYLFDPRTPASELPGFNVMRDLRNPDGTYNFSTENQMQYHVFLGGSMIEEDDYNFPTGVALQLPAHVGIDMNTHFINDGTSTISGGAYANLYTVPATSVQHAAQTIFQPKTDFSLPPHKITVVVDSVINPSLYALSIFTLTSHCHARAQKFQIMIKGGPRNGEVIYESTDWSHPLVKTYNPPVIVNQGEGIKTLVTYNNTTDNVITFGLKSTDEMDVVYGYFY